MERSITIRVPGTSANCGPGFDTLGVACTIYNDITLSLLQEPELSIELEGEGAENIPCDSRNMVWRSIQTLLTRAHKDKEYQGARIHMVNRVPLSRGLGSSASAIVSGIKAANVLIDNYFSRAELLQIATDIEGHPDNVAPAIYGGFTVSIVENHKAESFSFVPRIPLQMVVAVPDFFLSTKAARKVLPEKVPMQDAIFNIGRSSMLVAALIKGNIRFLRHAFEDALHQPYRESLIPGMADVIKAAKREGALGACISGAGPCIIAYTVEHPHEVASAMEQAFAKNSVKAKALILDVDRRGAHILKQDEI